MLKLFRSTGVLAMLMAAPFGGASAQDATLKMNTVAFCPETPYEQWYPTSDATMYNEGKMTISRDSVYFDVLGKFRYTVHTSPEGLTYIELFDVKANARIYQFVYLTYVDMPLVSARQSCLLRVFFCENQPEVLAMLKEASENHDILFEKSFCSAEMSYFRSADLNKLSGLFPPDIHK